MPGVFYRIQLKAAGSLGEESANGFRCSCTYAFSWIRVTAA